MRIYSNSERVGIIEKSIKKLSLKANIQGVFLFGLGIPLFLYFKELSILFVIFAAISTALFIVSLYTLASGKPLKVYQDILESEDIVSAYIDMLNGNTTYYDEKATHQVINKSLHRHIDIYEYFVMPIVSNENLDVFLKDEVTDPAFYKQVISKERYEELSKLYKENMDEYVVEMAKYNFFYDIEYNTEI